jgi:hypothetical protein
LFGGRLAQGLHISVGLYGVVLLSRQESAHAMGQSTANQEADPDFSAAWKTIWTPPGELKA